MGILPRVQCVVVHPRVCDGEEEVLAEVSVLCTRPHVEGLGIAINNSPRAKREDFLRTQGLGVPGKGPGQRVSLRDECGPEPR